MIGGTVLRVNICSQPYTFGVSDFRSYTVAFDYKTWFYYTIYYCMLTVIEDMDMVLKRKRLLMGTY